MVSKEKGNQAQITSYYDPDAVQRLKTLSETTRVPQSVYLREALDDLLRKYANKPKPRGRICAHEWHMASCRKCGKSRPLKSLSDKYKPFVPNPSEKP